MWRAPHLVDRFVSHLPFRMNGMRTTALDLEKLDQVIDLLEKVNAGIRPQALDGDLARDGMARYARIEKLASFGLTAMAGKVERPAEVARATGTSLGRPGAW